MPFWQFFRKGWDGRALLVRPSKMHHSIWKILFVLGANEYLERLGGKIRKCSFMLKYSKITVCLITKCSSQILMTFPDGFKINLDHCEPLSQGLFMKAMFLRYHSRFFNCLSHPNLCATLATDQKWPLNCLRISYQSLAKCHLP